MSSPHLTAAFVQAVEKARAGEGLRDYQDMLEKFMALQKEITTPETVQPRAVFFDSLRAKLARAAEGFISLLSFSGPLPEKYSSRSEKLFDKSPSGFHTNFLQGEKRPLLFREASEHPSLHVLENLGIGLPPFMPLDGEYAKMTPPRGAPQNMARVDYEEMARALDDLLDMARAAKTDLTVTYPNTVRMALPPAAGEDRIITGVKDWRQEMGAAHVFTDPAIVGPAPSYAGLLVSIDIRKPFDAAKYPPGHAALSRHRHAQREAALRPKPRPMTEAERQAQIAAFVARKSASTSSPGNS